MTMRQFKTRWEACVDHLLQWGTLSIYDYFKLMKPSYIPVIQDKGWSKTANFGHLYEGDAVEYRDWGADTLNYTLCAIQMEDSDQIGYEVTWTCKPQDL